MKLALSKFPKALFSDFTFFYRHDDSNDKYGEQQLEPSLAYDENISSSPKFNFPLKKSIYSNKSLIPTQTRSVDIYSQSPLGRGGMQLEEHEEQEEVQQPHMVRPNEEEVEVDMIPVGRIALGDALKTPSPSRRLTLDSINSLNDKSDQKNGRHAEIIIQRTYSFGTSANAAGDSSAMKNASKMKPEDEEEEEGDYEDSTGSHSMSSKKKVCCNCKKSRCLKLYCDCFARGKGCTKECNCMNCLNNEENAEERRSAMQNTLERNPIAFKPKVNLTDGQEAVILLFLYYSMTNIID